MWPSVLNVAQQTVALSFELLTLFRLERKRVPKGPAAAVDLNAVWLCARDE
jgi:hypothetical protein